MKELLLGILLIILIGVGGFLYRNAMQSPVPLGPLQRACTEEAKICPDGSAVGRIGPSCEFQECPTSTIPLGTTPEMFVAIPQGYVENENINRDLKSGGDMTIQRAFEKPSLTEGVPHAIVLRQLSVTSEDGIEDDIVRNTIFETSDRGAESIDQFEKRVIGGRTYYVVTVERFEAQIHTLYYLPIETNSDFTNLYSFEVLERDVVTWMEPDLVVEDLPEHRAFITMLEGLQTN